MIGDPPHIAAMVLHELPAQRRAEFQAAYDRCQEATAEIAAAEQRLAKAMTAKEELAARAATVGSVPARETAAATNAVRDAEQHLAFSHTVVANAELLKTVADQKLMVAQTEAYLPVLAEGARRRIAAASRVSAAQAELSAARADFDAGTKLAQHAIMRGIATKLPASGPMSMPGHLPTEPHGEAAERKLWAWLEPVEMETAA